MKLIFLALFYLVMFSSYGKNFVIGVPPGLIKNSPEVIRFLKDSYSEIGIKASFNEYPYHRLEQLLDDNEIDADFLRQDFIALSNKGRLVVPHLATLNLYAYFLRENTKINNTNLGVELLKKKDLGVAYKAGAANSRLFKDHKKVISAQSVEQMYELLKIRRIDYFVTSAHLCLKYPEVNCRLIRESKLHHIISKQNESVSKSLTAVIKRRLSPEKIKRFSEEIQSAVTKVTY